MFLNFVEWMESKKLIPIFGAAAAAGVAGMNLPHHAQTEIQSTIEVKEVDDGRNFIVTFKNLSSPDESTGSRGRFIRKYYEQAKDIVMEWLLDHEGISIKTSGQLIRSAGTANLELSNYEVDHNGRKIIFTIHQKNP